MFFLSFESILICSVLSHAVHPLLPALSAPRGVFTRTIPLISLSLSLLSLPLSFSLSFPYFTFLSPPLICFCLIHCPPPPPCPTSHSSPLPCSLPFALL